MLKNRLFSIECMDSDSVKKFCERKGYLFKQIGENPRLILMGEAHNEPEYISGQLELIREVRPKRVLHECYYPAHIETPVKEEDPYGFKALNKLSKELSFKLVPGDISNMIEQQKLILGLEGVISRINSWPQELPRDGLFTNDIYARYFDRLMLEPIMGYLIQEQMKQTKGKVIGIFGASHLLPNSFIHHILRGTFPPVYGSNRFLPMTDPPSFDKQDYIIVYQYKDDIDMVKEFCSDIS